MNQERNFTPEEYFSWEEKQLEKHEPIDRDVLNEGVQKAQDRIAELDRGTVQSIPGDVALAQVRQLLGK